MILKIILKKLAQRYGTGLMSSIYSPLEKETNGKELLVISKNCWGFHTAMELAMADVDIVVMSLLRKMDRLTSIAKELSVFFNWPIAMPGINSL